MEVVLEDNRLNKFIYNDIPSHPTIYAQVLEEWRKCVAKARRIILEGVRDHIVSNLNGKDTPYAMWQALIDLFQNNSDHRKLALKYNIWKIKMDKGDIMPQYLIIFTQCRDELGSVNITVVEDDLVILALLGLPKRWHSY